MINICLKYHIYIIGYLCPYSFYWQEYIKSYETAGFFEYQCCNARNSLPKWLPQFSAFLKACQFFYFTQLLQFSAFHHFYFILCFFFGGRGLFFCCRISQHKNTHTIHCFFFHFSNRANRMLDAFLKY